MDACAALGNDITFKFGNITFRFTKVRVEVGAKIPVKMNVKPVNIGLRRGK